MASIFKYLPAVFADGLIRRGEVLLRSLSYFQAIEGSRGDPIEGRSLFAPPRGLPITNRTQGWHRTVGDSSLLTTVRRPDLCFVFCASLVCDPYLARKFGTNCCVEITDPERFYALLRTALRRNPRVKLATLRRGPVEYYDSTETDGIAWGLPDRIIFRKRRLPFFVEEQEYRIAFSQDRDAYKVENVDARLVVGGTAKVPQHPAAEMLLRLASIEPFSKAHYFEVGTE